MNKCTITVLKKTFDRELAEEYGAEGLTACPILREGQVFYADYACPEGFCDEAWKGIYQYVFALAHGVGEDGGLFLLRRLDPQTRRGHLQLQRRPAACDFQNRENGPESGNRVYAGKIISRNRPGEYRAHMNLVDLALWDKPCGEREKGAKIPWNDPDFSRRMLENHLAQDHDWASRRNDIIARHTDWIAGELRRTPSRILDLGCGPGFYTRSLAEKGHHCVGVDFSPASIEYARQQSADTGPEPEYILCDIRDNTSERKFDFIIMTFGEFNVFTRQDARAILDNCGRVTNAARGRPVRP